MIEAALTYARAGLRVHPCNPANKRPLTKWGSWATTDDAMIQRWWGIMCPDALIAVCTGSGLVVVDDDRGLAEPDPDLAGTLTCRTRSRGFHHWFYTTRTYGNAVGLLPGIDIRGEGGYVIAPPSPGWEWLDADQPIDWLPDFVRVAWEERSSPSSPHRTSFEPSERVSEGGRNDYIARYAGYAIRMGLDDERELIDVCQDHNTLVCVPPLPVDEVNRTARSILARHRRSA